MIDEKYSAKAFADAGYGTENSRELSKGLQLAVLEELEPALALSMQNIIEQLNALGHNLVPFGPQPFGEKHFREPHPEDSKRYKFLVALDTVITIGYPYTTDK